MISTAHPLATEAGLSALRRGGSAVDAYIAAAAVQTVTEPTMTCLAGGLAVTVYDPAGGTVRGVGGMARLPAAEDGELDEDAHWSGRTVVAPGWVSGARAAWSRWGKLAWAALFEDAVICAREGFIVDQLLWGNMWEYRTVPGMYAAGREVWFPDGYLFSVGDVLRQPALARTLEQLAEQGPDFFYQGEFARHYVDMARAAGGRITLEDMATAQESAIDLELPALSLATGDVLYTTGVMYALALNLATVGGLEKRGLPTEDADTLYLLMRIVEEAWHHGLSLTEGSGYSPENLEKAAEAVSPETAEKLWPQVEAGSPRPIEPMNLNTEGIVAVDGEGMVAFGTHSTSGSPFGAGFMVDGVTVARPLYFFARPIVKIPAGWGTSLLAVRDGRPVFAAASPGISAFQNIFQNARNVLTLEMEPGESVRQPRFGASWYPSRRAMVESSMGDAVIDGVEQRGMGLKRVSPWELAMGSCHAICIDGDGTRRGAADPRRRGRVAGY
jgi:gamma-glutamyltranspeptidase/glutathione hydrolase